MRKVFLWILVLGFIGLAAGRWAVDKDPKPAQAPVIRPDQASLVLDDQVIQRFKLEGFDDVGDRAWKLVGDQAHVGANKDVFIEKDVFLVIAGGTLIRADKVLWQNSKARFLTQAFVRVHHRDLQIEGHGALGKLDQKFVQINQNVRIVTANGTILTGRGPLKIYQDEHRVTFLRDVWILDKRGAIHADRMDGEFDENERKLVRVVAQGNVEISKGDDVSTADRAIYDTRTGSVRLEGGPEIDIRNPENLNAVTRSTVS